MNYWLEIIYVGTLSTLLHHTDFILFMNLEFRIFQIHTNYDYRSIVKFNVKHDLILKIYRRQHAQR